MTFDPTLGPVLFSLAMVAVVALGWGAVRVWRGGDRQKGTLMFGAALVILGNVLIWTV